MTIIAILLAFALCHFIRELGRFRNHRWLRSWVDLANDALGKLPGWSGITGFIVILAVPLALLLLLNEALVSMFGTTGLSHESRGVTPAKSPRSVAHHERAEIRCRSRPFPAGPAYRRGAFRRMSASSLPR